MATNRKAEAWPEFLTVAEIAVILRTSKMTVYRIVNSGDLESTTVAGRCIRVKAALRAYIERH
jgi:excisionase family DNA binding protein